MKKRTIEDYLFEDYRSMKRFSFYLIRKLLEDAYQAFLDDKNIDFEGIRSALDLLERQQIAARPSQYQKYNHNKI